MADACGVDSWGGEWHRLFAGVLVPELFAREERQETSQGCQSPTSQCQDPPQALACDTAVRMIRSWAGVNSYPVAGEGCSLFVVFGERAATPAASSTSTSLRSYIPAV